MVEEIYRKLLAGEQAREVLELVHQLHIYRAMSVPVRNGAILASESRSQ